MKTKRALAVLFWLIGGALAVPSYLALFFGALALKLLPWFPPFKALLAWAACLSLAALVGTALLKQSNVWRSEVEPK